MAFIYAFYRTSSVPDPWQRLSKLIITKNLVMGILTFILEMRKVKSKEAKNVS